MATGSKGERKKRNVATKATQSVTPLTNHRLFSFNCALRLSLYFIDQSQLQLVGFVP